MKTPSDELCPDCKDADNKLKSGRYSTAIAPCPHQEDEMSGSNDSPTTCEFCKHRESFYHTSYVVSKDGNLDDAGIDICFIIDNCVTKETPSCGSYEEKRK